MVNKLTWLLGLTSLAVGCAMFHEIEQEPTEAKNATEMQKMLRKAKLNPMPCPVSVWTEEKSQEEEEDIFKYAWFYLYNGLIGTGFMALGLFIAHFGAGIRTVAVCANAFVLLGVPLLVPVFTELSHDINHPKDITPEVLTTVLAALIAASNASLVVLKSSDTTRAAIQGFTTGMLFSGFLMGFWLPELDKLPQFSIPVCPDIETSMAQMELIKAAAEAKDYSFVPDCQPIETKEQMDKLKKWIIMAGTAAPGIFMAGLATRDFAREVVWSFSFALIGGFFFIGTVSSWLGGGHVSITALANGSFGACATEGYVSMGLLGFVLLSGMQCSLRRATPPGPLGLLFCFLFWLEYKLQAQAEKQENKIAKETGVDPKDKQKGPKIPGLPGSRKRSKKVGGADEESGKPDLEAMFG